MFPGKRNEVAKSIEQNDLIRIPLDPDLCYKFSILLLLPKDKPKNEKEVRPIFERFIGISCKNNFLFRSRRQTRSLLIELLLFFKMIFIIADSDDYITIDGHKRVDVEPIQRGYDLIPKMTQDVNTAFYGFNTDLFSVGWKTAHRQSIEKPLDENHPFVLANFRSKKQIIETDNAVRDAKLPKPVLQKWDEFYGDWRDEITVWWNSYVDLGYESDDTRVKQLFLHGPTSTGKTYFINQILSKNFFSSKNSCVFVCLLARLFFFLNR